MARDELNAAGWTVFLPYESVVRPVRRAGRIRGQTRQEPVFPRYLFVDAEFEDAARIARTRGVARVLGDEQGPLDLPDGVIDRLRAMCAAGGLMNSRDLVRLSNRLGFRVGDIFNFKPGVALSALAGKIVSLDRLDRDGMVGAEVTLFGRASPVDVRWQDILAAADGSSRPREIVERIAA